MKKRPRWVTALVALTVILSTTLAPLEGAAAPGPLSLPEDPRYLVGDPDSPPYNLLLPILYFAQSNCFFVRLAVMTVPRLDLAPAPASHSTGVKRP